MKKTFVVAALATLAMAGVAEARDQIRIVGSSTVFPFTTTVAENFGRTTSFKAPVVESTGTGGGMKLFCAGVGVEHPDATNASRAIKKGEVEDCKKNGVADIVEMEVGFDGIVLAQAKGQPATDLTIEQLYKALAAEIVVDGKVTKNPYKMWSDIDPKLIAKRIEVLGPPPTSGTRDAFVELVMEVGCKKSGMEKAFEGTGMDAKAAGGACKKMREDGAFVEAGENDVLIVQKLVANKNAYGIFGYSFLEESQDKIQGAKLGGVDPNFENIASAKYPVARSLFVYVKKAHVGVIPGLKEFVEEYVSEKSFGDDGYLEKKGLIPLPKAKREEIRARVKNLTALTM